MKKDFIYLASASPRRRELLGRIGVRFEVRPAGIAEAQRASEAPAAYVLRIAERKAAAVCEQLDAHTLRPVLAADTIVVLDERILGKPVDARAAEQMLEALSGRVHTVLTAVALACGPRTESLVNASEVQVRVTTAAERRAYCRTGEPFDKAGAYAIQGLAAVFVEHLSGSHSGVMGLPLFETATLLGRCGVPTWLDRGEAA